MSRDEYGVGSERPLASVERDALAPPDREWSRAACLDWRECRLSYRRMRTAGVEPALPALLVHLPSRRHAGAKA